MNLAHALTPAVLCLAPLPALAELEFCNTTDETVSIAIGYNDDGVWTSEGWWNATAGDCTTVVSGALPKRYYYWRATSPTHSWEREDERYMFCTSPKVFTIAGDEDCAARGYDRNPFNEIDLNGATAYTMTLNASGSHSAVPDRDQPMTAPSSNAAPGTYGEPYTVAGLLSHCDWYDEGLGCTVLADGWRYVASSYDHTEADTLVALDDLGVNVPVTISGDMTHTEGGTAMVTIRDWRVEGSDPWAPSRAALQGFWTSTDDAAYQVLVHGSVFEEYYDGVPDLTQTMMFRDGCPGAPGNGPAFELIADDGTTDRCVSVGATGVTALELMVAGTMRPLTFRRAN